MCGIAGIVGRNAVANGVERMCARQHHRGPDDRGLWVDGPVALGHTRLRVIDLTGAGRQPMCSAGGSSVLVYNGEIYNFRELRKMLRDRGHCFRSETDTEVVLEAWSEWGPQCLERLEGMYAFAVWDGRKQALHVVRDRLGIKPVYWYHDGVGTFVFASEVRALLDSGLVPRALSREVLPVFLSQQTAPTPLTLVAGVQMLQPGSVLRIEVAEGRAVAPDLHKYWDPARQGLEKREQVAGLKPEAAVAGLRERLGAAVARRLAADVPLGAFLSGGVDSTAVVGLMTRACRAPVRTFTVAFQEEGYDDGPFARLAAKHLGTEHTEIRLSSDELLECIPAAVAAQDHPSGDGVNTWMVSRAARRAGLTVALSGLGGDELFGGYPTFRRLAALQRVRPALGLLPPGLRSGAGRMLRAACAGVTTDKLATLLLTDGTVSEAYPILRQVFGAEQIASLLAGAGERGEPDLYSILLRRAFDGEGAILSPLQRVSVAELTCYMRDVLLRDTDQMSMAHSLEVRVPFLDRELVEYVLALPDEARRPASPPKRYLVRALGDLLPEAIRSRPKSGFAMPFEHWMRGPLRGFCEMGIESAASHPAFRGEAVRRLWRDFLERDPSLTWSRPWLVVALGWWLERESVGRAA